MRQYLSSSQYHHNNTEKKKKGKHERTLLPIALRKGISRKMSHPRLRKKRTELNSNTSKKKKDVFPRVQGKKKKDL